MCRVTYLSFSANVLCCNVTFVLIWVILIVVLGEFLTCYFIKDPSVIQIIFWIKSFEEFSSVVYIFFYLTLLYLLVVLQHKFWEVLHRLSLPPRSNSSHNHLKDAHVLDESLNINFIAEIIIGFVEIWKLKAFLSFFFLKFVATLLAARTTIVSNQPNYVVAIADFYRLPHFNAGNHLFLVLICHLCLCTPLLAIISLLRVQSAKQWSVVGEFLIITDEHKANNKQYTLITSYFSQNVLESFNLPLNFIVFGALAENKFIIAIYGICKKVRSIDS